MATILWCLHHDWPKDVKIQNRISSTNLVLLLSLQLQTYIWVGRFMDIQCGLDFVMMSWFQVFIQSRIYNLGRFLTRWWIGMLFLRKY